MSSGGLAQLGVLGSGKGSNMVALAQACARSEIPARIAIVIADVPDAGILDRARELGIPARFIEPGPFRTKLDEAAEARYLEALQEAGVDWLVLAGFMRVLKGGLLRNYPHRVVNIHPSLLPSFPGLSAWRQALEYGVKVTGCTVHLVDEGVDTGPIVAQRAVAVRDDDTVASLHARIQEAERVLYAEAMGRLLAGGWQVEGRRVTGGASVT